jgi:methyl-accepting chemotaxis protein
MKWFNNLKVTQKLVSGFVLVAIVMNISVFIAMGSMNNINKNVKSMYTEDLVGINVLGNLIANSLQTKADELLVLDAKNRSDLQKNKDIITNTDF